MSKKILFIVLATLALAGCQDDKAQAPAEPAAAPDATVTETRQPAAPTQQQPAILPTGNAVAVTKPAKSNIAQRMQTALQQTGADMKAQAVAMQPHTTAADKPAGATAPVAKQVTAEPTAVKAAVANTAPAKIVHAKTAVAAAVQAVPAARPSISNTAVSKPVATASAQSAPPAVALAMAGNAANGQRLARKCKACHNFTARKKVGPGLKAVFGRQAGAMPDMKYSAALAAGGWVWNEKNLALWICNSKQAVKTLSGNPSAKTKMGPQRICDASKQADLIAFLKTL